MPEHDDEDLRVLRSLLTVEPGELDESRRRTHAALHARLARPARHPVRRRPTARRWVPALAAALILLVVLGAVSYLRRPVAEQAASPPTIDVAPAFDALAAAAAGQDPVTLGRGQVLYVRTDGVTADFEHSPAFKFHYRYEAWEDPEGMVPLRARRYETRMDIPVLDMRQAELARGQIARPGTDLATATPAWIAQLPTDPVAMRATLGSASASVRGDWSVDQGVWEAMRQFLPTADPLLPPAVRTALYRALAGLSGLTAVRIEIAGRPVVSLRRVERTSVVELLFDERTGRFLGEGSGALDLPLVTRAPSPVPDVPLERTITTRLLVTCTVVSRDQIPA